MCSDRFLVHESVHDEFVARLKVAVEKLTVTEGKDNGDVGPLINGAAVSLMEERVREAVEGGAVVVAGGARVDLNGGNFFAPTILTGVQPAAAVFSHENFGPVAAIVMFKSDEEALQIIKSTSSAGLAAYVMSENYRTIEKYSRELQFGIVGINEGIVSNAFAPFGGVKSSGIGREGFVDGIKEYTYQKYVYLDC